MKFKYYLFISFLIAVSIGAKPLLAQEKKEQAGAFAGAPIKLYTSLISKEYRNGDADIYWIKLKLGFRIANESAETILLPKECCEISHIWIGIDEESLGKKHYEASISQRNFQFFSIPPRTLTLGDFQAIPKKGVFEMTSDMILFGANDPSAKIAGAISKGCHYLQLKVDSYPNTDEAHKKIEERFKNDGRIIWGIKSEPMKFCLE